MTTRDGIGAPRKREVVYRDARALALIRERASHGLCTRLGDLREVLDHDLSRSQVYYVVRRLQAAGLIERRAGYLWCLTEEG